jgi:mono/diheme cytochrome c family protein
VDACVGCHVYSDAPHGRPNPHDGRNWIGAFLEPHPRDLTDREFARTRSRRQLAQAIGDGIPGTSMPAWKSVLEADEIDSILAYIARAFTLSGARPD